MRPHAKELDETGRFPREIIRKAAELGLTGVTIPEELRRRGDGSRQLFDRDRRNFARLRFHRGDSLGSELALRRVRFIALAARSRSRNFLVPFARGEKIGCYALTEPQAGSNAAAIATKAVRKGDRYVVNGTKAWITNGGVADAAIVYVKTQPEKNEKGITALVIEKGTPGFSVGKEEKKLGVHATACTELSFVGLRSAGCESPGR